MVFGLSDGLGKLEIIVEFCAKGSLLHHLRAKRNSKEKDFQPVDVVDYAHQIALGMEYLAEKKARAFMMYNDVIITCGFPVIYSVSIVT